MDCPMVAYEVRQMLIYKKKVRACILIAFGVVDNQNETADAISLQTKAIQILLTVRQALP